MRILAAATALLALGAAGCGGASRPAAAPAGSPFRRPVELAATRSPVALHGTFSDAANLASADVTHNFGQLPAFIDNAAYRLLPYDTGRALSPGEQSRRVYRLTVPRTQLVLDTVVTSALTEDEAREDAAQFRVSVSLDGKPLARSQRYWVFYRNTGAQICRIYFPGDLGALNMGVHSVVFRPLAAGRHLVHVVVRQALPGAAARLVSDYRLRVLPRGPDAHEIALSPNEQAGNRRAVNRTPFTFRQPQR